MEKRYFSQLVFASFIKSLTLSLAGLIDCAVVGRFLGADGLSAMKLAMPVYSFLSLFSAVFGTGLSITVSRELTENGVARANEIFRSVFSVLCALGACLMALGLLNPGLLSDLLTGSSCDPAVRAQAAEYFRPILIGALPILLYDLFATIAMLGGAVRELRLASAALFIVDVGGDLLAVRLHQGMLGIAVASAASYAAAFLVILCYVLSKKCMFLPGLRLPERGALRRVIQFGLPGGLILLCNIVRPVLVNRFSLAYGTMVGLAALSVQDAVRYVPGALCNGISKATLILAGVFVAESDLAALRKEKISILRWSFIGCTAVAVVLMLLASPLLWIFTGDEAVHTLGVSALRLYLAGVPFFAVNASTMSLFQGMGEKQSSIRVAVFNRLLSPVFFAWLLGKHFGNLGIYASFPVSEVYVTLSLVIILLLKKRRKNTILPETLRKTDVIAELRVRIADPEQAMAASQEVRQLCLDNGFSPKRAFYVALTVEELAMNSLTHGFDDGKNHHLELRAIITGEQLILRLRDDGRPFDLTERYKMMNPDDPSRNIGLRIIFAAADEVTYHSSLSLNNVCIKIDKDGARSGAF